MKLLTLETAFERLLVFGSALILIALMTFGVITANRSADMDVTASNELVFASSRALNGVDAIRFAAKQAALNDPDLADDELAMRVSIVRARLENFTQGELFEIDDTAIQKHVERLNTILARIDATMNRVDCDSVCQGTVLLKETRLAKRVIIKLQGRGLVVDGKVRREINAFNASIIQRIFLSCLAIMAFAGLVVLVVALKNRQLQRQKAQLTESQHRLIEVGLYRAQFLAGMSHEFRTPLNAIKGFSQLILMLKGEMPREQLLEYITDIEKSAVDLEQTTNSVLDISKIDAGTFDLHEKTTDLVEIVQDVKKQFGVGIGQSRIELDTPESMHMLCDPTAIKRCVQNLVSNALKFSPEDTSVKIAIGTSARGVDITVVDHGSGIPASDQESVWQAYSRSSYTRYSDKQGTGLGLPIVEALIQEHGGQAELQSKVGVGTVVTLTLPAERIRTFEAEDESEARRQAA